MIDPAVALRVGQGRHDAAAQEIDRDRVHGRPGREDREVGPEHQFFQQQVERLEIQDFSGSGLADDHAAPVDRDGRPGGQPFAQELLGLELGDLVAVQERDTVRSEKLFSDAAAIAAHDLHGAQVAEAV